MPSPSRRHYCPLHLEDIIAPPHSSVAAMMVNGQADGDLRLNGFESSRLVGTVQMTFFGYWYTICNYFFTLRESAVVCRQLGLGYPVQIFNQDTDGPNKTKPVIHLLAGWPFVTMVFD